MSSGGQDPNTWPVLRGKHILIAEDEPSVRGVLRRVFEMQGCTVHEAENGQRAAALARQVPVDLVMTDLWMPIMNGVELIEVLNAMDCPAEVIVLSAHITCATTEKLRRLGVFRILKKPTEIATLLDTVQAGVRSDRRGRLAEEFAEGIGSGADDGPALVLVADDDAEVRGLLRGLLTGAGYRVEEARDGEEAVEKVLAHDVSLVLMDLNMPRMSGQEAVEVLRRAWGHDGMTRTRVSPPRTGTGELLRANVVSPGFIVCMTGECTKREMDEGLRAGAVSCFRKPFDVAALLAEVERLDAISLHRKRLAERERALRARGTVLERIHAFVASMRDRCGRRLKRAAATAAAIMTCLRAPLALRVPSSATRRGS